MSQIKKVYLGEAISMCGNKLFINTADDEPFDLFIRDDVLRKGLYCKPIKITVEELTEEEFKRELKPAN